MHFFLRILLELVSSLFSFLVEWFLCYEQPLLYGGALSPVVTAFLYTVLLLVVWLLPIFYDACREKGGIAVIALNLLPTEIIFGGEFLYRLPLAGAAVLILWGVAAWLLWYERYDRNVNAWNKGKRGIEYDIIRRRNRRIAVRCFVLITAFLLLIPGLYGIHVVFAGQAGAAVVSYEAFYYEMDPSFLVDLRNNGLIGTI